MIQAQTQAAVHCSPVDPNDSAYFDVDQEDVGHVIKILRSWLYSDKIAAVVREYVANAWDAHREAGKGDQPIEVTLPSAGSLLFEVKDFGLGLSHEDIRRIFTRVGKSTKRQNKDAVGFLGIGCKSGHAYADNFVVISRHGGRRRTYALVIDADSRSQSRLMDDSEGDPGDTGLTIQVPVKPADVWRFSSYARDMFRNMTPRPRTNVEVPPAIPLGPHGAIVRGAEKFVAVMGCVTYPVDLSQLHVLPFLREMGGVLRCEIGEVDFAASREALEYTDRTKRALEIKLEALVDEVVAEGLRAAQQAETAWERRLVLREKLLGIDVPILRQHVEVLSKDSLKLPSSTALNFWSWQSTLRLARWKETFVLPVSRDTRLVFRGADRRRGKRYQMKRSDIVVMLTEGTEEAAGRDALRDLLKSIGATGVPTVDIASLPYDHVSTGPRAKPFHSSRHKMFEVVRDGGMRARAESWVPVEREPQKTDVYVLLDAWIVDGFDFYRTLMADREVFARAGVEFPPVYGYRGQARKRTKGLEYREWRERTYRQLLRSNAYIRGMRDDWAWRVQWSGCSELRQEVRGKIGSFLDRACRAQQRMWGCYDDAKVAEYLHALVPQEEPKKLWAEIQRSWPLIQTVDRLDEICRGHVRSAWVDYLNRNSRRAK